MRQLLLSILMLLYVQKPLRKLKTHPNTKENLALSPHQRPASVPEVVRSKVALYHRPEVDVQDTWAAVWSCAL